MRCVTHRFLDTPTGSEENSGISGAQSATREKGSVTDRDTGTHQKTPRNGLPHLLNADRQAWNKEYRRLLESCKARPVKVIDPSITSLPPHQLPTKYQEILRDDDVICSIASVWYGLVEADIDFAFGNTNLFQFTQSTRMVGACAVRGSHPLIIPLLLHGELATLESVAESHAHSPSLTIFSATQRAEEDAQRGGFPATIATEQNDSVSKDHLAISQEEQEHGCKEIDHILLAIAERVDETGAVRLKFLDSRPNFEELDIIRRAARNIARDSGWLDDTWPDFVAEEWATVPAQRGNRCGEHTVLNAWAYMLNIPVVKEKRLNHYFYKQVRELINCALRGQLDSATIRAFMQYYEYTEPHVFDAVRQFEERTSETYQGLRRMQSVAMNEEFLNEIVARMQAEAQVVIASREPEASTNDSPIEPKSWQERLNEGLKRHRRRWQRSIGQGLAPAQIKLPRNLGIDQVVVAIASIWEALRVKDVLHAFAALDVFSPLPLEAKDRAEFPTYGVVGGSKKFVMPLMFHPALSLNSESSSKGNREEKGGRDDRIGHLLLGVAMVTGDGVRIHIIDSSPGIVPQEEIREKARDFLTKSGWAGLDELHNPTRNEDIPVIFPTVPRQVRGSNSCGLHVIFNAWAVMLKILLTPDFPGQGLDSAGFLERGLEIVNLALAGFMDSETIRAFMRVYGYSREQDLRDPAEDFVPVNAVRMTAVKLNLAVRQQRDQDRLSKAFQISITEEKIEELSHYVNVATSRDQLITTLIVTDGNIEEAVQRLHSPPASPSPAVSPKAPELPAFLDEDFKILMNIAEGATKEQVIEALEDANGDVMQAGERLFRSPSPQPTGP